MFTLDQGGRRRDELSSRPPPSELEPWVERLVVDRRPAREVGPWRIVPDPSAHLLLFAAAPTSGSSWGPLLRGSVAGARSRFVDAPVSRRHTTLGVRFRPGALATLLGIPARELTDRSISLEEAFGARGRRAMERAAEAGGAREALNVVAGMLARHARPRDYVDWRARGVIRLLANGRGRRTPGELAERTGMSPRTLRSAMAEQVGLSPRQLVRIDRLLRALRLELDAPATPWSRIALRAGYHDGPHLSREARALLGEPLGSFRARRV